MADRTITSKSHLLSEIARTWAALNSYVAQLSEAQMTAFHDDHGRTVKDHLTHLTAWEQSVVFHFQGKPRHQALGIEETLFASGSFDEQNEVIRGQRESIPLAEVIAQLQRTHVELMNLVNLLTEADLSRQLRDYPPETPATDQRSVMSLIQGDTADHFSEHLSWIEALVQAAG